MKTICLLGGKLQGFEVAYLAKKAEIKTVLVDRNPEALIRKYTDEFHSFDIIKEPGRLVELSREVDAVIPLNENPDCIGFLKSVKEKLFCPIFFDFDAYSVSRDKKKSKEYFASVGTPTPLDNPDEPPYFVKPSCESGSVGTAIIYSKEELEKLDSSMLVEEYVEGDVVSLEVVGDGIRFAVVKETKVHIDGTYDCHKVTPLPYDPIFREISHALARGFCLKGIMDVEAIQSQKGLKVIEIDARFPSQTPTVVYHTSGINLVELVFQAFDGEVREIETLPKDAYCIYEHLMLEEKTRTLIPVGEHMLSENSEYGEYYSEPGLEIFMCSGKNTVFTMISHASDRAETEKQREKGLFVLAENFGVTV